MSNLVFDDVVVRYGRGRRTVTAVKGVSLTIPDGSVVGVIGESGSGKSSLARSAFGLAPLSAGSVRVDGQDATVLRRRHRGALQMIFQDPYASLDPRMSIGRSIAEAIPSSLKLGRTARRLEVARLLELVNLDPGRADSRPDRLSGGQRQRVAIARAVAARPQVVVADEITSALDVSVQGSVLNLVRDLRRSIDLTMLFISHDLAVVRYVCDTVAVMYDGRLVEVGPTVDLLTDPQHPYTQELLAAADPRQWRRRDGSALGTEPPDPATRLSGCGYQTRRPGSPPVDATSEVCKTDDPRRAPSDRVPCTACHFPGRRPCLAQASQKPTK